MLVRKPGTFSMKRLRPLPQGRYRLLLTGVLLTVCAVFFLYYPPDLLRFFDYRLYDLLVASRSAAENRKLPIVVGIDEASLEQFGQWPWPRYRLAQLVDALQEQQVAAIGLDILLPEADRTSPDVILRERRRDLGEEVAVNGWLPGGRSNDQRLAEALSRAPVVLASKFLFGEQAQSPQAPRPDPLSQLTVRRESGSELRWLKPSGMLTSLEPLNAAAQLGFVNAPTDRDGVVRRLPLLMGYGDHYYPSLALATLLQASDEKQLQLELLVEEARLTWSGQQVPLDARGNLLLGFSAQPGFHYLSAADLLLGRLPPGSLAGQIAFVGVRATGLGDRHVTPNGPDQPGVELHALAVASLLNGDWYSHPVWARGAELFAVVLFGLLSTLLLARYEVLPPLALLVCGTLLAGWTSASLFAQARLFVSPTLPILVLLLNTACLSLLKYGSEVSKLRQRTQDLLRAQDATIVSLTTLADTRDNDTGAHILRTQGYVRALAEQLRKRPRYRFELTDEDVEMLSKSAPLHDVGKVGIPDRILLKTGRLSVDERQQMQDHTRLGSEALVRASAVLGQPENSAFLHYARQMAESHHERWDGSGYPYGLKGEAIPLAGRLMAVADVYDALISRRSYKDAYSHERAKATILEKSGVYFDPEIVAAFLACEDRFLEISTAYHDELPLKVDAR